MHFRLSWIICAQGVRDQHAIGCKVLLYFFVSVGLEFSFSELAAGPNIPKLCLEESPSAISHFPKCINGHELTTNSFLSFLHCLCNLFLCRLELNAIK